MAVGQNLRYLSGVAYHPIERAVFFKRLKLGVHPGYMGVWPTAPPRKLLRHSSLQQRQPSFAFRKMREDVLPDISHQKHAYIPEKEPETVQGLYFILGKQEKHKKQRLAPQLSLAFISISLAGTGSASRGNLWDCRARERPGERSRSVGGVDGKAKRFSKSGTLDLELQIGLLKSKRSSLKMFWGELVGLSLGFGQNAIWAL